MKQLDFHPGLLQLAKVFDEAGHTLYAVGGLVRNAMLGIPPSDMDICSALMPEEVLTLLRGKDIRVIEKAPHLGTVELHALGGVFEHTTFRADSYAKGGAHRPEGVRFGVSLEEDALRRDFTCNALYADILTGRIFDPTGGIKDIKKRLVRATNKDPRIIMRDDGLRVMRLARFCAELSFAPEKNTLKAAKDCSDGLLDIAWERKRDELTKILLSDAKYPALTEQGEHPVLVGLKLLYHLCALEHIIPELLEGDGVAQQAKYHAYDVLLHNFHVCAATPSALVLRLAGLLHDVGKPAALREKGLDMSAGGGDERPSGLEKGLTPMLFHDSLGADMAKEILTRLRYPNAVTDDAVFLIRNHMYDLNGRAKQSTLRARFCEFGYDRSRALIFLREADVLGSGRCVAFSMHTWREALENMRTENAPFSLDELDCTGKDIMAWLNLPPCKEVGIIKQRLLKHCAVFPKDNTNSRLRRVIKGMKYS